MTMTNNNQPFDFNSTIDIPDQEFITLEPRTYEFTVEKTEFGYHQPSPQSNGKMPANTPKVTVYIGIETPQGKAVVRDTFFMYPTMKWRIGAFFKSIGLLPEDAKELSMNWDKVIGKQGYCVTKNVPGRNEGTEFTNIDKYLKPSQVQKAPTSSYNGML